MSARVTLGLDLELVLEAEKKFDLEIRLGVGLGPAALTFRPGEKQAPFSLADVLGALGKMLGISALENLSKVGGDGIWKKFFDISILPELTVILDDNASSIQARFLLYTKPSRDEKYYGIRFSDYLEQYVPFITIEPDITVYDLIISYWKEEGLDLRARIKIWPQESENVLADGTVLRLREEEGPSKTEVVKYPFPTPDQGGPLFRVNYLGLGQRFGPRLVWAVSDPIAEVFKELQGLRSNDPSTVLNNLAKHYYHPDRNWFFGADIDVKGWRVQAIFNDPAMYGLRVTCDTHTFKGFKFEIQYQKLSPDLGVYYGAISVPEKFRNINLGAVALKLPSFEIWIYTNGDFKLSVGWPLGPNSIGFEIYIFIGGCAFYIAKLRTGFNPCASEPTIYYNPIVAFGLAVKIGLGRTLNAGSLRVELSLTLQGIFQGILAWEGDNPALLNSPNDRLRLAARKASAERSLTRTPDYFWFSATIGIVGVLQGEIDLKILKVSILIRLSVTAGVAFETGYVSIVRVTATVKAEASIKVLFVKISISFSLTLTETFQLSDGTGLASIDGPQNPNFQGIVPDQLTRRHSRAAILYELRQLMQDTEPAKLAIHMVLFPAALYRGGTGQSNIVALPMIAPPGDEAKDYTDYDILLARFGAWLLREWAPTEHSWTEVLAALGQGRDTAPEGFRQKLESFVASELRFVLQGVDFYSEAEPELDLLPLPMLPPLAVQVPGQTDPIVFADDLIPAGYEEEVRRYFDDLSLSGIGSNPDFTSRLAAEETERQSFVDLIFIEYFLMLGRDMARRLAEPPPDDTGPTGMLGNDIKTIAKQLAGMATRTLIGGVLLPDPKELETLAHDPAKVDLLGLYEIARQMFPAVVKEEEPVNSVTFTLHDPNAPLAPAIEFVSGDSVVSRIPVANAPHVPNPIWHGTQLAAAVADITISPLPPVTTVRRWFASHDHEAWSDADTDRRLLLPPPELMSLSAVGPLTLLGQKNAPDPTTPPKPDITLIPALIIQFRIHKVSIQTGGQVGDDGTILPDVLKGVYEISTTDDATRDRIGELLTSDDIATTRLALIRVGTDGGYYTLPSASPEAVFLFKTNLSTLTQPETLFRPMARMATDSEDIDEASIANVQGFLRLIWQVSVVNASGFYLNYTGTDDAPLPDDMFGDDGTAVLTVLAQADELRAMKHHDSALILPDCAKDTVFIAANIADGTPVEVHQPSYPAGCTAFQIDWRSAPALTLAEADHPAPYDPDTIAALYDIIQFRIRGSDTSSGFNPSLWSLPLSRAKDDVMGGDEDGPGTYRQVVPAYRFAVGGEDSLYAAVGKKLDLEFRLLDTYGNALSEASHTSRFEVLYHDPLVPLGEWPGTRATYRVDTDGSGAPNLYLVLDFQPSEVVRPEVHHYLTLAVGNDDKARQQAEVARFRYGLIVAQLRDPNVDVRMLSTFFGPLGLVSDDDALKAALGNFAAEVLADLDRFLANDGADLVEKRAQIGVPFDKTQLVNQPDTIFPVSVEAEISRSDFVDPEAAKKIPGIATSRWRVPPDLNKPEVKRSANEPAEVDLRHFADRFEKAFDEFDGGTGTLKLSVCNGTSDFSAADGDPVLWGIKLSETDGLSITFKKDEAAYFTLVPISTRLESHEGVEVTSWDADLVPRTETRAFSGIDVDGWARGFLRAVDGILSPGPSSAIIRAAADRFSHFGIAKRLLAECLKAGVERILVPPDGTEISLFGARAVIEGDLVSARDRFEQQVLTRLAAGYDSLVVLQVPVQVTNSQKATPPEAEAPRLFGGVIAKGSEVADDTPRDAFSVSNTRLPSVPPQGGGARHVNFLVSAVNPSQQAKLDLELTWEAGFLEHRITTSEAAGSYVPSSWLRVIDTPTAERLSFRLDSVSVPIPSIGYPTAPVLSSHGAVQQSEMSSDDIFLWRYEAALRKLDRDAKDTLVAELHLNEPVEVTATLRSLAQGLGEKGDVMPLFEALARFTVAWPELEPLVQELVADKVSSEKADTLIKILEDLVRDVAICWAGFRGVPIPDLWTDFVCTRAFRAAAPIEQKVSYKIDFERAYLSKPELVVTSDQDKLWPAINGVKPSDTEEKFTRTYRYDDCGEEIALHWPGLDALDQQTARLSLSLVRNSNLGAPGETITNPNLVYRTPPTTFASPVIPHLRLVKYRNPQSYDTLAETLYQTLGILLGIASVTRNERSVKIETRYEYGYISDPRQPDEQVWAHAPVLLSDGIEIALSRDTDKADPVCNLAEVIAHDISLWRQAEPLPSKGAELVQTLTLFAVIHDVHQPILTVDRVLYKVPEGWWGDESSL